jgi:ferric-dicitrate binding protein FerR (iron transport regulator)
MEKWTEEAKKERLAWRDTSGCSSILQEDGEAEEDAAEESGEAETSVGHEDGASAALVATVVAVAGTSLGSTAEAGDGDGVCSYAVGSSWGGGGRHGSGEGGVATVRFLSTAWVVLAVESC